MGLDRTIRFPTADAPDWAAIRAALGCFGEPVAIRMIDGLPAFPDESPEAGWKELRLGLPAGMVTLRRGPGALTAVIWGTGEPALTQAWHQVVWACASAGGGVIETPSGPQSAQDFLRETGLG